MRSMRTRSVRVDMRWEFRESIRLATDFWGVLDVIFWDRDGCGLCKWGFEGVEGGWTDTKMIPLLTWAALLLLDPEPSEGCLPESLPESLPDSLPRVDLEDGIVIVKRRQAKAVVVK